MSEIDNIYKLLSEGERVTLECKKATKGVPSSLWDTYSAFANTYGGTILLGLVEHMDEQDNVKQFEIVGVEDADKIRMDLWKARNQRMQNMFRMIGYGENLGSGFPLILNAWNEKHWIKPELLEQSELMQVKLTLHIQNRLKNEPVNEPVNERQQAILSAMKQNPSITREDLANKINVSLATLKRDLASLKKAGYITRSGSDKNGHWILIK